jgi:hypothetical protein
MLFGPGEGASRKERSMLVDTGKTAAKSIVSGAIRQAAQATGTSFNYLLATARVESGLNPQAGASSSSARGLYQFIEQTWLATLKQSGPALGFQRYAAAITQTSSGYYEVRDRSLRSEILALRSDPTANALMAGAFTKANATALSAQLGRPATESELYIAHFLGADGAGRLVRLADSDPNAKAADVFSKAAQANPSIFYDRTGAARTLAQVRTMLAARYDAARGSAAQPAAATAEAVTPASSSAPDTAGITGAFATVGASHTARNGYGMFQTLFTDPAAGSSHIAALWQAPRASLAAAASNAHRAHHAGSAAIGDLFKPAVKGAPHAG